MLVGNVANFNGFIFVEVMFFEISENKILQKLPAIQYLCWLQVGKFQGLYEICMGDHNMLQATHYMTTLPMAGNDLHMYNKAIGLVC